MRERKATVGFVLLCALVFCAFAASSAQAQKGTPAFTCVKEGKELRGEHCLSTGGGALEYSHKEIPEETNTEIEGTNEKTQSETKESSLADLHFITGGITVKISCSGAKARAHFRNRRPPLSYKQAVITAIQIGWSSCKITIKAGKGVCEVKGGEIVAEATGESKTNESGEMWIQYTGSKSSEVFTEFTLTGEGCGALNGVTIKVKGTAIGTPKGAALEFKKEEPKNALKVGESKAEIAWTETLKTVEKGIPIVFTTTPE